MKLFNYAILFALAIFCSLSSTTCTFAIDEEEQDPGRRGTFSGTGEREDARAFNQPSQTNTLLQYQGFTQLPTSVLTNISTFLGIEVYKYARSCHAVNACIKEAHVPVLYEVYKENYLVPNLFTKLNSFPKLGLTVHYAEDKTLRQIGTLTQLLILELTDLTKVTDAGLQHLCAIHNLRKLTLDGVEDTTDKGLRHLLSGLHKLESLHLRQMPTITDSGLEGIRDLHRIRNLTLDGLEVRGAGLEHISGLSKLKCLYLRRMPKITDYGLQHLSHLHRLEYLSLYNFSIVTNNGFLHLCGLPNLKMLDLQGFYQVTNEGIAALVALGNLKRLYLEHMPEVTDIGCLRGLHKLEKLELWRMPGVTETSIASLRVHLPNLQIKRHKD